MSRLRRLFSRRPPSVTARNRARLPLLGRLLRMLRKARLRGDYKAHIVVSARLSPGVRLTVSPRGTACNSTWMLPMSREERKQYRSTLAGGRVLPRRRTAPMEGLLKGTRGNGVRFLLRFAPRRGPIPRKHGRYTS